MPRSDNERFDPSYEISEQLENLIREKGLDLNTVTDLSNDDIDFLLNTIRIESSYKAVLMDIVKHHTKTSPNMDTRELYDLKVKVLLDNLAKKMCRCVNNIASKQSKQCIDTANPEKCMLSSAHGICRKSIFHNKNIDFYTYSCDQNGPLLNIQKDGTQIIHKRP
jgi:hypothetical protein